MKGRSNVPGQVVSINVGAVETRDYAGRLVATASHKQPVGEAKLTRLGFEGDSQADLRHHGGPDKAACVYSADHYRHWEALWAVELAPGAFGENITVAGMREAEVCIGDVFRVGESTVQITQPRQPCSKLAARHAWPDLVQEIRKNGFSGFYVRVIEEGGVRAGDPLELLAPDPAGVSIEFANRVMYRQPDDPSNLERLLSVPALSEAWREALSSRARK